MLPIAEAPLCGAPALKLAGGKDGAATMAVREPILKALLGYKKATSEAAREAHRRRAGVTVAWPSKVLSTARVLPSAGVPRSATTATLCGLPAPKPAGGKDGAARMAVREPILKALLAYKKAKSGTEREAHRRRLRELFEKIEASAAEPFERMLSTPNALAVTFRDVLQGGRHGRWAAGQGRCGRRE